MSTDKKAEATQLDNRNVFIALWGNQRWGLWTVEGSATCYERLHTLKITLLAYYIIYDSLARCFFFVKCQFRLKKLKIHEKETFKINFRFGHHNRSQISEI